MNKNPNKNEVGPSQRNTYQGGLKGLSSHVAKERLLKEGQNLLPENLPVSSLRLMLEVVTEPMFLMLLAAGVLYMVLGDLAEAVFLLGVVVIVIGMTLYQHGKTQRQIESLRELSAPRALVIRDGLEMRIAGREVVRGDLLVLSEGDRVAADATLLEGRLDIDESLLTGESTTVLKMTGASSDTQLFASTVVTKGHGIAQVTAISIATAFGKISTDLAHTEEFPSLLQRRARRLIRWLGGLALLLALTQILLSWLWNDAELIPSILLGIALAMAILPEEIPVVLTVFLALGAWRLSKTNVLVRRVTAVEALGGMTVLAVDKTGTLTMNQMSVVELITAQGRFSIESGISASTELQPILLEESFKQVAEIALLASPSKPFDPMERAIQSICKQSTHDQALPIIPEAVHVYELSTDILAMTLVHATEEPGNYALATKGAPEAIASLCKLNPGVLAKMQHDVADMASRGLRVLGVANGKWVNTDRNALSPSWPESQRDLTLNFVGLIGFMDPIRPEVPDAMARCRRAGVRVIMMTGDHLATAVSIAQKIGLSNQPNCLTGPDLDALTDEALQKRLRQIDLCARMKPSHKLRLVRLLQASGEVIGMTGDGVNDAPALRAADIGIAMGERGTDVARESSDLVLLNDSFASIVSAISQGRRIDANIRKATGFIFSVHVPIIALALIPALLHWPVLLIPAHIVLLELVIDPACTLVFADEPEQPDLMTHQPRAKEDSPFSLHAALPPLFQGLGAAFLLVGGYALLSSVGWNDGAIRSVVMTSLLLTVMLLILTNRDQKHSLYQAAIAPNRWLRRLYVAIAIVLVAFFTIPWLREIMKLVPLTLVDAGAIIVLLVLCILWLEGVRLLALKWPHFGQKKSTSPVAPRDVQ